MRSAGARKVPTEPTLPHARAAEPDGRFARGEARRTLILDAAVRVLASGGVGVLTHRAAAEAGGVSLASVTYHFPSITELRGAVFEHVASRVGLAFRDRAVGLGLDSAAIPAMVADFLVSLLSEHRADARALIELIAGAGHEPELRTLVHAYDARLAELLEVYVGSRETAEIATAAVQGLLLVSLTASVEPEEGDAADVGRITSNLHASTIYLLESLRRPS
jgi:TetR/AcrR family transcriptional regulator, regulator of biofilm formation and stress response